MVIEQVKENDYGRRTAIEDRRPEKDVEERERDVAGSTCIRKDIDKRRRSECTREQARRQPLWALGKINNVGTVFLTTGPKDS